MLLHHCLLTQRPCFILPSPLTVPVTQCSQLAASTTPWATCTQVGAQTTTCLQTPTPKSPSVTSMIFLLSGTMTHAVTPEALTAHCQNTDESSMMVLTLQPQQSQRNVVEIPGKKPCLCLETPLGFLMYFLGVTNISSRSQLPCY